MKKIIYILTIVALSLGLFVNILSYHNFSKELNKVEKTKNKTLTLGLEDYYYISPNDIILGQYALKTGLFAFNNNQSNDGVYNKNWLPLAYNYCLTMKTNDYMKTNDFDNDGIPNTLDQYPYDYTNGNFSIRNSQTNDFDNDGIPNVSDDDADGNGLKDIYQAICINKNLNSSKQFYSDKFVNIFQRDESNIKENIGATISVFIDKYKIETGLDEKSINKLIENIFDELKYKDSVFVELKGKTLYIKRDLVINQTSE